MATAEDILIKNAELFINVMKNVSSDEKSRNIITLLDEGANVNERFANNSNNTSLHIAVRKEDSVIVKVLLEKGGDITITNDEDKTALDIAKELNTDTGRLIIDIIQKYDHKLQEKNKKNHFLSDVSECNNFVSDQLFMYQKRTGTTGIKGELYETKLLSLILVRILLHKGIEQFILGTSLHGIGALDDICLRYTENNNETVVFLQAKHIIKGKVIYQDLWKSTGNYSLSKYFNSYLKIRDKFESTNRDSLFRGKYEDLKCHFVIYTTAEDEMSGKKVLNNQSVDKTVRKILSTGDNCDIFQYRYDDGDVKLLTKVILEERMRQIGKILIRFTRGNKYKNMMRDKYIRDYHVVLAKQVIAVSDLVVDDAHVGSFRKEFLSSNNEMMILLKESLFKEVVKDVRISDDTLIEIVDKALCQPSVTNISKLVQSVPTNYDKKHNRLEVLNNTIKEVFSSSLYERTISQTTFNEAYQIAVTEKLGTLCLKLPLIFGNIDIRINKLDFESVLNNIAEKIEKIILNFDSKNIIINSSDKIDILLIGNLIVFDDFSGNFKFNIRAASLGPNSACILNKLHKKIFNLEAYTLQFNVDNIPKMSFEADENDNGFVKDFLGKLWFYTRQAKEHKIELYAKDFIKHHYNAIPERSHSTFSCVQSDAIFLKIHSEVQKWWLLEASQVHYITKHFQTFNTIFDDLTSNSLLSILNYIYTSEIDKSGIEFNEEAVYSLGLDKLTGFIIIETENKTLTAIKLYQYFKQVDKCKFIDLNYAQNLSLPDNGILIKELMKNDTEIVIIIYEPNDVFFRLLTVLTTKKVILVINENNVEKVIQNAIVNECVRVKDEKNSLYDLTLTSQRKILQKQLIFLGFEICFDTLIDAKSKGLLAPNILNYIIDNKRIEIGKTLNTLNYEQIKDYYVQRQLFRSRVRVTCDELSLQLSSSEDDEYINEAQEELITLKTLEDIIGTVVLMAAPGMGKSTLVTHLSMVTKENNPALWIERVNLLDHAADFNKWQQYDLKINHLEAIRFLCKIVLTKHFGKTNLKFNYVEIDFGLEDINGNISLKDCDDLEVLKRFELEIFINCYNRGNTILIFDGFDEICPHYKNKVTELLQRLANKSFRISNNNATDYQEVKQHMWITSRPYNDIKKTLEAEFGISYSLKPFTDMEQNFFVEKYLRINLNLKNLNYQQFESIDNLFDYMTQFSDLRRDTNVIMIIKSTSAPLHSLYCAAISYFQSEITHTPLSLEKSMFKEKWTSNIRWKKSSELLATWNHVSEEAMNLARTPLHMNIAVSYIESQIKDSEKYNLTSQWDLDTNTFAFYENFLETKLKKIRFEEKNHMDLLNPDLRITYERERLEFITKHKKLAFYSIFKKDVHQILDRIEIYKIEKTIKRIENGEEKTGLIEYIVNGVPKFVHLTFAEYLAAEYISDLLKTDIHQEQMKIWKFFLYIVLPNSSSGFLEVFDRKVNCDPVLLHAIGRLDLKKLVFDSFMDNDFYLDAIPNFSAHTKSLTTSKDYVRTTLDIAVYCRMINVAKLIVAAIADKVTEETLLDFLKFVKYQKFFKLSVKYGYDEILDIILNCVRRVDGKKLHRLYYIPQKKDSKLPLFGCTNEEIINYLKCYLVVDLEVCGRKEKTLNSNVTRKKTYRRIKCK